MYLIELIVKWINPKKKYLPKKQYDPFAQEDLQDDSDCRHVFLPVDSTGETLACSKCGLLVNKKDLKDENIFKRSDK